MTSLWSSGQRDDTSIVSIAEVSDDAAVVRVRIEDFIHEVKTGAVVEQFMIAFFGARLQPEFETHF